MSPTTKPIPTMHLSLFTLVLSLRASSFNSMWPVFVMDEMLAFGSASLKHRFGWSISDGHTAGQMSSGQWLLAVTMVANSVGQLVGFGVSPWLSYRLGARDTMVLVTNALVIAGIVAEVV